MLMSLDGRLNDGEPRGLGPKGKVIAVRSYCCYVFFPITYVIYDQIGTFSSIAYGAQRGATRARPMIVPREGSQDRKTHTGVSARGCV